MEDSTDILTVIIQDGKHLLMTPGGAIFPRVTETTIHQDTEQSILGEGIVDFCFLCDRRIPDSALINILITDEKVFQLPTGERLRFIDQETIHTNTHVSAVKAKARCAFPFDTVTVHNGR